MIFPPSVHKLFYQWEETDLLASLEDSCQQLLDRRKDAVEFGDPKLLSAKMRAALNCELLRQALLHRAERLLRSSCIVLLENDLYGLALIVRGHYETTALL